MWWHQQLPVDVFIFRNMPQASQAAPNDTERSVGVRNNPTQAKGRLEWATQAFVANAKSRCHFSLNL
jgi:hypothetical protein